MCQASHCAKSHSAYPFGPEGLDFGRPVAPLYTLEDLKRHVFNLQGSGIGDDLKQSTPAVCGFKSSPV
jgi:hypothetical protein